MGWPCIQFTCMWAINSIPSRFTTSFSLVLGHFGYVGIVEKEDLELALKPCSWNLHQSFFP
jgi:hypothetical protein